MTMDWIQALQGRVEMESTRTMSTFVELAQQRERVATKLTEALVRLGGGVDGRERVVDTARRERTLAALRSGHYVGLDGRDQRLAATMFDEVEPLQMQDFLLAHPTAWKSFATECMKRWDRLCQLVQQPMYSRLLCLSPKTLGFLHDSLRVTSIASLDGPAALAQILKGDDLGQARDDLQRRGFQTSWAYSASTLAAWLGRRSTKRNTFARTWLVLSRDPMLEAALLPPLASGPSSWFGAGQRPARVRKSVDAWATAVAALIRTAHQSGADSDAWNTFTEGLLRSTFGDPRIAFESQGWRRLRERDATAFQQFLEVLITEDITVFFEHAMSDQRRKAFWLRYLTSLRRTACVLNGSMHQRLHDRFAGSDKKLAAAISRAQRFRTTTGANAFCLYFDSIVIVEFSETGNAAQVYDRAVFQKHFEQDVYGNRCQGPAALKSKTLVTDRIIHTHSGWEDDTERVLRRFGIHPDRAQR